MYIYWKVSRSRFPIACSSLSEIKYSRIDQRLSDTADNMKYVILVQFDFNNFQKLILHYVLKSRYTPLKHSKNKNKAYMFPLKYK